MMEIECKIFSYFVQSAVDKRIYQNDNTHIAIEYIKEKYKEISKEECVSSVIEVLDTMKLFVEDY